MLDRSYTDGGWWLFDHRIDLTDEVFALAGEEAPRRWMRVRDVKALLEKGKDPLDLRHRTGTFISVDNPQLLIPA